MSIPGTNGSMQKFGLLPDDRRAKSIHQKQKREYLGNLDAQILAVMDHRTWIQWMQAPRYRLALPYVLYRVLIESMMIKRRGLKVGHTHLNALSHDDTVLHATFH
jgi:hypothetical protein